ncbi:AFL164Cp [Eremothecium gossypii ATCC 10895]|uniref:AFL164Cp n=1 Tax=Eremothecium gossypii (strain ATCC 10895 / CBS 109.51 / FGSC 9923 / NRRL Y-1056) TaxID=284811 RepID=Q755I7_EREGS|nr:AFL164Cp [Eremothecium gossypii ATCC 10895]AAS53210.2 AFL164Cp [Eremothecium gossypii ATCC 10895]AEY97520.1 FAFL164Cp [Eremothecium gossypii FDAG1]
MYSTSVRTVQPCVTAARRLQQTWAPPTYFNTPAQAPRAQAAPARKPLLEGALFVAVGTLAFFAVDNYRERTAAEVRLQKQLLESQRMHEVFTRQVNAARRKRELQVLNERKATQIRQMKMALHIAMLREQLHDRGVEAVGVDQVLQEFDRHVRMENSISNVSGTSLWVVDDAPAKPYVPNVRDYDPTGTPAGTS